MSTPFGTRGFYWEQWRHIIEGKMSILFGGEQDLSRWKYFEVPAESCPRITQEFLEEEKMTMGTRWFEQEYHCKFLDAQTAAFRREDIEKLVKPGGEHWLFNSHHSLRSMSGLM